MAAAGSQTDETIHLLGCNFAKCSTNLNKKLQQQCMSVQLKQTSTISGVTTLCIDI